jgi:hypothetical protein
MKHFMVLSAAMVFMISTNNLPAQERQINVFLQNELQTPSFRSLNKARVQKVFNKTAIANNQVYYPETLTLYTMNDTMRMSASYIESGLDDQILIQAWFNGQWVNYERRTWTYLDSSTESNLTLRQRWSNGQWVNLEQDSSTYDANGNMLVHLVSYWTNGQWHDSLLSSRMYDVNENMLTNVGWVMINNQWTNSWRGTYTYDDHGNELTFLDEMWSNAQWVNMNMWTYTYDDYGHMLTCLAQVWSGQWGNASLATYTYDANGNMLSFLTQFSANMQWTNSTIHTYTYNASGKMLTDWLKAWANDAWMNGTLCTCTYDANGNELNYLIQEWLNGQWTNYRQSTFTYDAQGNELTGNNTLWSGSSWVPTDYDFPLVVSGSTTNFTGYKIIISWILVTTTDVTSNGNTIVNGYSLSQNYPNPFNPSTTISFHIPLKSFVSLTVVDIIGREVATIVSEEMPAGSYSTIWNASKMPSGIYFYRLQAGSLIETKKLVLLK